MPAWYNRVDPNEPSPPPPAWLAEFAAQSAGGICGGLAVGGYQGLVTARSMGVSKTPREAASQAFVRGALAGGARIGGFVTLFAALAQVFEHTRGARDGINYAAAAAVTGAAFASPAGAVASGRAGVLAGGAGSLAGMGLTMLEGQVGGKLFDVVQREREAEETREPVPVAEVVAAMERGVARGARGAGE